MSGGRVPGPPHVARCVTRVARGYRPFATRGPLHADTPAERARALPIGCAVGFLPPAPRYPALMAAPWRFHGNVTSPCTCRARSVAVTVAAFLRPARHSGRIHPVEVVLIRASSRCVARRGIRQPARDSRARARRCCRSLHRPSLGALAASGNRRARGVLLLMSRSSVGLGAVLHRRAFGATRSRPSISPKDVEGLSGGSCSGRPPWWPRLWVFRGVDSSCSAHRREYRRAWHRGDLFGIAAQAQRLVKDSRT